VDAATTLLLELSFSTVSTHMAASSASSEVKTQDSWAAQAAELQMGPREC